MKYANGNLQLNGEQISTFVCAKTYKRMIEILEDYHVNAYHFNGWWSKCANDKMKEVAQDKEGIWITRKRFSDDWENLRGKNNGI